MVGRMPIDSIPEVLSVFAQLAIRLGATPLNQHAGCWQLALDRNWHVAMNAHREEHNGGPTGGMEFAVPPFTLAVWWNGWLAGTIDPTGGVIAAGSGANEESLIAAIKAYRPEVVPDAT